MNRTVKMTIDERRKHLTIKWPEYRAAGRKERGEMAAEMAKVTGLRRETVVRLLCGPTLARTPRRTGTLADLRLGGAGGRGDGVACAG